MKELNIEQLNTLMHTIHFAAEKHKYQRRKGQGDIPYINHPIKVCNILVEKGGVSDLATLMGAILHDTIEDTETTPEELTEIFGEEISKLVMEVTDNKNLSSVERKKHQVTHSCHASKKARNIKLADKSCNVLDLVISPPIWPVQRKRNYLQWAKDVVDSIRGTNPQLEAYFDDCVLRCEKAFGLNN